MKFTSIFLLSLFGLSVMATADAGEECNPTDFAVKAAVVAKTGYPQGVFNVVTGSFQYDVGNKTCSGWVMLDHQHRARLVLVNNLQVTAPK